MDPKIINKIKDTGYELFTQFGVKVVGVLVMLLIAWILAGWAARLTAKALRRAKFDETLLKFFSKLVKWLVLIMAGLACLGVFGIQTTSFAAVIGAAGLAIGLAFQGTLGNFSAGVMLLIFRPFKVGDVINSAGQLGKVDEIDLFTTTLDTPDNRRVVIPNGAIFGAVIENISHHPTRRVDVSVGTDYGADLDRTRETLLNAASGIAMRIDDPPPAVVLLELGASSVDWSVRVWCQTADFWDVKQALTRGVKMALDEAGIAIPFPQMDVHLEQIGGP